MKKIGKGSFGEVFQGTNIETNENIALKFESCSTKHPQLQYESRIYRILEGSVGIPSLYWYGTESSYNIMAIELLGPSLEELCQLCNRKMSLKTVLMLTDQLILRIEYLHSKNFLHRDIKPDNFMIGLGQKKTTVYVIDFGLAKKYKDRSTNRHIMFRQGKSLTGTARYASIYTHLGYEQSRRDDLEGLAYVLIYILKGSLPWQALEGETKEERYQKIFEKKNSITADELCVGLPIEFANFLNYAKSLKFEENPDYSYIKNLFKDLFQRENYTFDLIYDWTRLIIRKDSLNLEQYGLPILGNSQNSVEEEKQS